MSTRPLTNSVTKQLNDPTGQVFTVLGPVAPQELGLVDAHAHVWIEAIPGTDPASPVLDNPAASLEELARFRRDGGGTIVDCQPYGCGRDGRVLVDLAQASGVHIVACTGFHLRNYYPLDAPTWSWTEQQATDFFIRELSDGLSETQAWRAPVPAGFIKVACQASLEGSPQHLLRAAAAAARACAAAIEIHTEKSQDAERIVNFFTGQQVDPGRLVLCHVDKRPDFGLHRELAQAGVLLEYDTFFRPKYNPEDNLWPLLEKMLTAGLAGSIALATDLADAAEWSVNGGPFGLPGLAAAVRPRLLDMGISGKSLTRIMGGNIAARLARPEVQPS